MTEKAHRKIKQLLNRGSIIWWQRGVTAFCIIVATLILSINLLPLQVSLKAGDIAPSDVYYDGTATTYISTLQTEAAKNKAADEVGQILKFDKTVLGAVMIDIDKDFAAITQTVDDQTLSDEARLYVLRETLPGTYSDEVLRYILSYNQQDLAKLKESFKTIVAAAYDGGLSSDDIPAAKDQVAAAIGNLNYSDNCIKFLLYYNEGKEWPPSKVYDAVATAGAVEKAMNKVSSVQVTVQSGEKIISKGSIVTPEQVESLEMLGMKKESLQILPYFGLFLIVAICFWLLHLYMRYYQKRDYENRSSWILMTVVVLLVLLLCKLLSLPDISDNTEVAKQIGYLLPVPAAAILLAVLLRRGIAIFCTIILSVFMGIICGGDLAFTIVAIGGSLAGILSTHNLNQRSQFISSSFYIMVTNAILIASWGLLWSQSSEAILSGVIIGAINGFLSTILVMGTLPYLEGASGVTTVVKLLELSNSNQPLLKRLMIEAPGTYNHSILVGNLAESAADEVGADPLLVRVASYYHDIGKLKRPYFFIENQSSPDNPHDNLQVSLSAMILTSHVKDGIELLKENHFPWEIIDIVEQHHGTSVLSFFYKKALENAENASSVRQDDFRYPGRKPQTKEAALVLLADVVQAAVQSLVGDERNKIEAKVREVIKSKVDDGQLQECPLTFKDIGIIANAFLMVLSGFNHQRIEYPEDVAKEVGAVIDEDKYKDNQQPNNDGDQQGNQEPVAETGQADDQSGGAEN